MFELPVLPYSDDALEPVISSKTIAFHYGKHHKAYVDNLNKLVVGTEFEKMTLEDIVLKSEGVIFNNAAQIWNHTFYFESFSKNGLKQPEGRLAELINKKYGSFNDFKEAFNKAAATVFGSGWAWLVINSNNELDIVQTSNAATPLTKGLKPLLTCDVWEHAYYIDYQNRRPDYINSFWEIINWEKIQNRL